MLSCGLLSIVTGSTGRGEIAVVKVRRGPSLRGMTVYTISAGLDVLCMLAGSIAVIMAALAIINDVFVIKACGSP